MLEIAYNFICQLYPINTEFFFFFKVVQSGVEPGICALFAAQYCVSLGATVQRGYVIFPKLAVSQRQNFYENLVFK